ncbi:hypothetical protein M758_4G231800 [Ceratodon purpureus]|nr:hypothetical protein M758_4G231800 [Ceratodon purpureus]
MGSQTEPQNHLQLINPRCSHQPISPLQFLRTPPAPAPTDSLRSAPAIPPRLPPLSHEHVPPHTTLRTSSSHLATTLSLTSPAPPASEASTLDPTPLLQFFHNPHNLEPRKAPTPLSHTSNSLHTHSKNAGCCTSLKPPQTRILTTPGLG